MIDVLRRLVAGAMAVTVYGASEAGPPNAQPPDADAIFSLARDATSMERCPKRLEYVIVVAAEIDGHTKQNHFRATYLFDSDYLHVDAISDEEQRSAYVPHGADILISLPGIPLVGLSRALTAGLNRDGPPSDLLGVPELKPSYTFGIRKRPPRQEAPQALETGQLRTIGSARSLRRDYAVELAGVESYNSQKAYHLRLTPLREPSHFRLREVWVDANTYAVLQVVTEGNFADGPPTKTKWLTTYQDIDGCRLIDREAALETLNYGGHRKYQKATVFFDVIKDATAYSSPLLIFRRPLGNDELSEPDE
ncbi:MAG: hypothetical protein IAI50_00420 [Candidatus Eremiobacteraeota bacterium]|nr:hypothetical protein [Candidatus Eremiobacteraeota bacterium]